MSALVLGSFQFALWEESMLSAASRRLTYLNALLYAVLGALLFILPEQLAPVFAWKATPFMTMTIGEQC